MRSVELFTVLDNVEVAQATHVMRLRGDCSGLTKPGQFVNVEVPGFYLRRPISVCFVDGDILALLYKELGQGTCAMAQIDQGAELSILSGLGNGFDVPRDMEYPLVVGGGIGIAPLYALCAELVREGKKPQVVFGFGSSSEVTLVDEIQQLGVDVALATVDGSAGTKGFVTDAIAELAGAAGGDSLPWDYLYACGPDPMLHALYRSVDLPGQFSLEERMACGFGACMGCVTETLEGYKRICKEGPVFKREDLAW